MDKLYNKLYNGLIIKDPIKIISPILLYIIDIYPNI